MTMTATAQPLAQSNLEWFHSFSDSGFAALFDYLECYDNGRFYEPPVNGDDLLALLRTGVHHSSAIGAKLNILSSTFVETPYLSHNEFSKFAYNFLVMGNAYLEAQRNRLGHIVSCKSRLALYMRKSSQHAGYVYLRGRLKKDENIAAQYWLCHNTWVSIA